MLCHLTAIVDVRILYVLTYGKYLRYLSYTLARSIDRLLKKSVYFGTVHSVGTILAVDITECAINNWSCIAGGVMRS